MKAKEERNSKGWLNHGHILYRQPLFMETKVPCGREWKKKWPFDFPLSNKVCSSTCFIVQRIEDEKSMMNQFFLFSLMWFLHEGGGEELEADANKDVTRIRSRIKVATSSHSSSSVLLFPTSISRSSITSYPFLSLHQAFLIQSTTLVRVICRWSKSGLYMCSIHAHIRVHQFIRTGDEQKLPCHKLQQ